MTDALSLVLAGAALVVAVLAAAFAKKQADHTKRQADTAEKALSKAAESNEIARGAWDEASAVREFAHREWHRTAQPAVTVTLGRGRAKPAGYELIVETDKDLDSCALELAEATPLTEVTGLSVGLTETIFNYQPQVVLRAVKAGAPAHPAMWLDPSADGVTVRLRCTVTIADATWGPTVHDVRIAPKPL